MRIGVDTSCWSNRRGFGASYDEVTGDFDRFTERYTSAIASRVVECARLTFSSMARKRLATVSADAVAGIRHEFDAGCVRAQGEGGRLHSDRRAHRDRKEGISPVPALGTGT
jgi:hypothetical protein